MNFRSLLNKLYLFLNQKSGIIRSRVTSPIRRTPRVLRRVSTLQMTHALMISEASTPRVLRGSSLYKRNPKAADSFANFFSSLSRFASFCVPEIPRSPGIILEPRGKSRDPEDPEKCGSRVEALPARSSIFIEIFQIC